MREGAEYEEWLGSGKSAVLILSYLTEEWREEEGCLVGTSSEVDAWENLERGRIEVNEYDER